MIDGTLSVQLSLTPVSVDELEYTIERAGTLERQGRFIVDGQTELRVVVGVLTPDSSYDLTLHGDARWRASGMSTTCDTRQAFSIAPGQTTSLGVAMQCDGAAPVTAPNHNVCPTIDAIRAVPDEAPIGTSVVLKADVIDVDSGPESLRYGWTADVGAFTDAASSRAGFQCTAPGVATIDLHVSDGDPSCTNEDAFVYVTCLDTGSDSAGASVAAAAGSGAAVAATPAAGSGGGGATIVLGTNGGVSGSSGVAGSAGQRR